MIALGLAGRGVFQDESLGWSFFDETGVVGGEGLGDRATAARPALAWFKDKLYMAWRGPGNDQDLFWATLKLQIGQPQPWSSQRGPLDKRASLTGPALMAFHGTLYMAWRGAGDDRRLFWATFDEDAQNWNPQQQVGENFASSFGPALAVFQDRMYMAWNGAKDDQNLYWTTFNEATGRWNPRRDLTDRGSARGPALVPFRNQLFMFWRGIFEEIDNPPLPPTVHDDDTIYFATFDGIGANPQWSPQTQVTPILRSIDMPSVAVFHGQIYIAHSPTFALGGEEEGLIIHISKFDGTNSVPTNITNFLFGAAVPLVAFPEITNSWKTFLLRQGFDPRQGTRQAGHGSLRYLMGLS
jgi:hypothetical protein